MVFADEWHVGQVFFSMLWFFLFFIWIWLLIMVFADIFRDHKMSGWAQGGVGHLRDHRPVPRRVRVPDRARRLDGRARRGAAAEGRRAVQAVRAIGRSAQRGASAADELARLADLKSKGVITDAEFEQLKAKALA